MQSLLNVNRKFYIDGIPFVGCFVCSGAHLWGLLIVSEHRLPDADISVLNDV